MYEDITCGQNLGLNRLVCINAHTGKHLGQHIYKGSKRWGVQAEGGPRGGGGETILSEHQGMLKPTESDKSDIVHRPHYLILPKLKHFWNVLGGRKNTEHF